MPIEDIVGEVRQNLTRLISTPTFNEWLAENSLQPSDYVLINNSFVYRNVSTNKSDKYVVLEADGNGALNPQPLIATSSRINLDFKHLGQRVPKPPVQSLNEAVAEQLDNLGELLFILIGEVEDATVLTETVGHGDFDAIHWNPQATEAVIIDGRDITVRDTNDDEPVNEAIGSHYEAQNEEPPAGLIEALGIALDQLQDQAVASLRIPVAGADVGIGITDSILEVLNEQRNQYATALEQSSTEELAAGMNEILRIAYNFASDATTYLSLIVSICDLKPLVLWGTLTEHVALSEAFKNLPWSRSRNKPSLKNYSATISDARNSAFHNLFPFRKTLLLALPEAALHDAELRIFSEHGRKRDNRLSFQDRELVDLLVEFTRARDRRVPPRFWRQNLVLMDATIELFSATNAFLKLLHTVREEYNENA